MNVPAMLDEVRAEHNVLEHPFYRRWSAGELSAPELACYASEYRHAVVALARASALAAAEAGGGDVAQLREHAVEEEAHVELWDRFAEAAGAREHDRVRPLAETQELVRAWTAGGDLLEHLAVLYAIEAGQPEIARTKLAGLSAHYGYGEQGPAVEYFELHERLDREHASQARALIDRALAKARDGGEAATRMVWSARAALLANWHMLDAVEARFAGTEANAAA